jgi:hypothetical protein
MTILCQRIDLECPTPYNVPSTFLGKPGEEIMIENREFTIYHVFEGRVFTHIAPDGTLLSEPTNVKACPIKKLHPGELQTNYTTKS